MGVCFLLLLGFVHGLYRVESVFAVGYAFVAAPHSPVSSSARRQNACSCEAMYAVHLALLG